MNELTPTSGRPATYQDVLDAPPNLVAELIRGALHLRPGPAWPHARAVSMLAVEIGGPFDRGVAGRADGGSSSSRGCISAPTYLAGWRRERMPVYPNAAWFDLAPDWVCEVLSLGMRQLDLTDKRDIYGASGVGCLWFVDPKARTLEAFERREGAWTLLAALKEDDEVRLAPFEAVAFPLSALWPD